MERKQPVGKVYLTSMWEVEESDLFSLEGEEEGGDFYAKIGYTPPIRPYLGYPLASFSITPQPWKHPYVVEELRPLSSAEEDEEIIIKRKPLLHITNFLIPILFFLCLDLSSFLISDQRGEKLGFKVTVLLAISVLLLILNDILPSTSNRTPLIATYCLGVFTFLLLSLLESVVVLYLIEKDSVHQQKDHDTTPDQNCDAEEKRCGRSVYTVAETNAPSEPLPVADKVIGGVRTQGESHLLLLLLEDLRAIHQTLGLFANSSNAWTPGYWTKVAQRINAVYFTFYLISVILFISLMCKEWLT
ncbi:hypothetical protein UPYG_G00069250 [Umbra pygmaea]|uniref:Neurotransmitter-gated ion-channel transmembrane domain-containing protein n=1 Tax=Umbra pygmaea TaxID=75934 RepID=A0ABD0Y0N8_UMBPY